MTRMNYSKIKVQKATNQAKAQEYFHRKSFKDIKLEKSQSEALKRMFSTKHKCRAIINCKYASLKQKNVARLYIESENKKLIKLIDAISKTLSDRYKNNFLT